MLDAASREALDQVVRSGPGRAAVAALRMPGEVARGLPTPLQSALGPLLLPGELVLSVRDTGRAPSCEGPMYVRRREDGARIVSRLAVVESKERARIASFLDAAHRKPDSDVRRGRFIRYGVRICRCRGSEQVSEPEWCLSLNGGGVTERRQALEQTRSKLSVYVFSV
jgi:hypothetical protein